LLLPGVVLAHWIEPGVRIQKVTLAKDTPALEFPAAGPGPHPAALLAQFEPLPGAPPAYFSFSPGQTIPTNNFDSTFVAGNWEWNAVINDTCGNGIAPSERWSDPNMIGQPGDGVPLDNKMASIQGSRCRLSKNNPRIATTSDLDCRSRLDISRPRSSPDSESGSPDATLGDGDGAARPSLPQRGKSRMLPFALVAAQKRSICDTKTSCSSSPRGASPIDALMSSVL
jgi:hypothetical protein